MIKILAGTVYEQNQPMGVASVLMAQFSFLAKSVLNMCTKIFFQTKVVTNHNTQLLMQNIFFDRPKGLACALKAQFGFLTKST